MKSRRGLAFVLLLSGLLWSGPSAQAAESRSSAASRTTPGLEAAQAISTITGVAISPLLGVSAIGALKYFKTPMERRAKLPWFAQPWFWAPGLLLVLTVFLKDTLGTALPTAVKKPLDVAETIENKISGLVAVGAFVPLIAAIFSAAGGDEGALYGEASLAFVNVAPLLNVLTVPFAMATFFVVWMVSHVINVLILVSPFTTVDAALKSARLAVLGTVAGTAFMDPYLGAVWSLVIVVICWFLAGWAFRLMVFGTVLAWDIATFGRTRFKVAPDSNWVFMARAIDKTPIRTFGKLARGPQGELALRYRPWLVLPERTLTLPPGKYAVGKGLFSSEIIRLEEDSTPAVLTLPPRCRGQEEEISSIYTLAGVQDVGARKGIKELWNALKELIGVTPQTAATG